MAMSAPLDLFNQYVDGELSPADWELLEAWISAEPGNAKAFLDWMALQAWTHDALRGHLLQQVLSEEPPLACAALKPDAKRPAWKTWAAVAASIIAAASYYWMQPLQTNEPAGPAAPVAIAAAGAAANADVVDTADAGARNANEQEMTEPNWPGGLSDSIAASLTGLRHCVWQDPAAAIGIGRQLHAGSRIALESGVARVTFESGAEALLKGPCDFIVDNAMHGTIRYGRVSVTAPKRAYGFRIRAPNAEVIDLGTEFGVAVDQGGHSEVHVFSGEVLSRSVDREGQQHGELIRVTANNAVKFADPAQSPSKIATNTSLFARKRMAAVAASARESVPSDAQLALWLAADASVKMAKDKPRKRVVAWSDILYGDNISAEDALQPDSAAQPALARKAINGRPAVRFNGSSSYLVTTPLETTDNQTIFIVCQFGKGAERPGRKRGSQILNYNGPPHRLVSSTYEPGVLQIGEPLAKKFEATRLGGKLFSGRLNGRDVSESEMYCEPLGAGVPIILAYRYDLEHHTSSLLINNELIDTKPALRPAGVTSRKVIGKHGFMKFHFAGDIGELLIFNSALEADDMNSVTQYLSKKYDISLKPPSAASTALSTDVEN
ncbi:MAG TPA: FecR domain-containing protein [Lacipirellula sp.]